MQRLAEEKVQQDAELAAGKQALVAAGYDVETMWVQPVCWGDHDQFQHGVCRVVKRVASSC